MSDKKCPHGKLLGPPCISCQQDKIERLTAEVADMKDQRDWYAASYDKEHDEVERLKEKSKEALEYLNRDTPYVHSAIAILEEE